LVQRLYDITPLEPLVAQGYTLLTPNHRLARRIKAQWDAQQIASGARTWEQVPVYPVEAWLHQQWELAARQGAASALIPLDSAQTLELWRQVIGEQAQHSDEFHLLRPTAAAELASQARELLVRWQVDVSANGIRQLFELDADCHTFLLWLERFEARLKTAGQCAQLDCLAQLPRLATQRPSARVALVEIDMLAPLVSAALAGLCTHTEQITSTATTADRFVYPCNDKRTELHALAAWAVKLHRTTPDATIGIVLSDMQADRAPLEYLLRREFDCLGQQYATLPVNFSTGITLARAPLVRDALAALAMGLQSTTIFAVENLMRSPFLDLPDSQSALAQYLLQRLYAQGKADLSITDLRSFANHIHLAGATGLALGQCLNALSGMEELKRKALPSVWQQRFSAVLSTWGWPGRRPLDSVEYQQLALWDRILDAFRAFDHVCAPIAFSKALALLRDCCHREVSQPQTADSPIQVLGPLEAAGLSFDHLWLCGMQGSSWPAAPRPNPFIPISLQNRFRMPHANAEREWSFADTLLAQYARSSGVLHASYCRQINGVPDMPSALLQDFKAQAAPEPPGIPPQWLEYHSTRSVQELQDDCGPALAPQQQSTIRGGSAILEDQSHCPFRAFAKHRLKTEPLPTLYVAASPGQRGAVLHEALYALWGELGDYANLVKLSSAELEQVVQAAAQSAIATVSAPSQRRTGAAYWRLEEQRLAVLLQEWLIVERQRSAFSVMQREQDISFELAGLPFQLRADRIDQLADGSHLIIDYKSGACAVRDWLGERPALPQLPLYSIASTPMASSLAFAKVSPRHCGFTGLGNVAAAPGVNTDIENAVKAKMIAQDWPELNQQWRSTLTQLAQAFVGGDAQVDPLSAASCAHCGLQSFCRVDNASDNAEYEAAHHSVDGEVAPGSVTQS